MFKACHSLQITEHICDNNLWALTCDEIIEGPMDVDLPNIKT